ncbi:MAG: regulatory protein RecX [Desulfuromonadales bacterium]|nr:regulatory protein RecX [Desulfuromonadales bacterium]
MTADSLMAAALRLLAVRDRTTVELAERLRQRGFAEEAIATALERCRDFGYLDDAHFARERARILRRDGRAVGEKAVHDLRLRGVPEELARAAVAEASGAATEGEVLRSLLERHFPDFCFAAADDRQRRRVVHYFLRRGFPLSGVMNILHGREDD